MPKRVTSPTARGGAGRTTTGAPGAGRGSSDAGGVIAPLNSALPPLAEEPTVPPTTPAPGAGAPGAGATAPVPDTNTRGVPATTVAEGGTVPAAHDRATPGVEDRLAGDGAGPDAAAVDLPIGEDAVEGRAARGRSPLRRPRTWMGAAVAAVAVALVAWGGVVLSGDNAVDSARSAVLAVAAHDITVLSTYDYRHLAHDNALARQIMTPAEWKAYAKPADSVRATIVKDKAVATAKVQAVGIVRATAGRVVVLAAVQQTINDNLLSGPATLPRSYEFTFVPVDGHWRVDYVEQL